MIEQDERHRVKLFKRDLRRACKRIVLRHTEYQLVIGKNDI
jgi:hypothetical protein